MSDADYLIKRAAKANIELVQLWYASVAGQLRGAVIPINQLEHVLDVGLPVGGHEVGLAAGSRYILRPDPSTWATLPWHPSGTVARLICDLDEADGRPAPVDTRAVLKAAMGRAAALDYRVYIGAGLHQYLVDATGAPLVGHGGGRPHGLDPASTELAFGADMVGLLEELGVATTGFGAAEGPGQLHVGFAYCDALTLADSLLTARAVANVAAKRHAVVATLMPFPFAGQSRSGLTLTLSLDTDDGDVELRTPQADGSQTLSSSAATILAALRSVHRDASLITRPTINSYTSPVASESVCRITEATGDERELAFVFAGADAIANPYLVLALLIDAVVAMNSVGSGRADSVHDGADAGTGTLGHSELGVPVTLAQAVDRARSSPAVAGALGQPLVDIVASAAEREGAAYRREVTAWEVSRYLRW